jgi:tRNA A-37 threonylcarbamoyl transferase component Bud32
VKPAELEALALALRRGEVPQGVVVLKHNPVRQVALADGVVLKVFLAPSRRSFREARRLRKAAALGVPVPELLAVGRDWVATRWVEGRPALREDLPRLLPVVEHMHEQGMLHCDLHLGNFLVQGEYVVLIDMQRTRFWPRLPQLLRRWELGRLAYSLGEPLPEELSGVRFWREVRAHQHWRSRTRRCLKESSGFTRFTVAGCQGFRRREADPEALTRALETLDQAELIWPRPGGQLYRSGPWVVKQHANVRAARNAWVAGHGLETRGIRTAQPVAWVDRWLIMEHAGGTVVEWAEACFTRASSTEQEEMMRTLADLLADLHRRGIYHADLKASNVTWSPGQPARLLDYQRVRFGIRVPQRRRSKNLAQLNAALPDIVPGPLRARGLDRYLERSEFRGDARKLRQAVIALSLRRSHRWHGC